MKHYSVEGPVLKTECSKLINVEDPGDTLIGEPGEFKEGEVVHEEDIHIKDVKVEQPDETYLKEVHAFRKPHKY